MTIRNCPNRDGAKILVSIGAICVLVAGCSRTDVCQSFPDELKQPLIAIYDLPNADMSAPAIDLARERIMQCYKHTSYVNSDYELAFSTAKSGQEGSFFLVYKLYGIEDLRLAFRVDKNGRIVEAFQFSAL